MHPLLSAEVIGTYAHRAAIGLQRHRHQPGIDLSIQVNERSSNRIALYWEPVAMSDAEQLDHHRVTEDAAEAIALGLVSVAHR